jgi:hypothetical protein
MRRITTEERQARLARRHHLAPELRAADVLAATRALVCLHATDPATVFLSAHARVDGMTVADLERALYVDRTLVKHLAMRRTLFVFPRELVAIAQAAASARVARTERTRLSRFVQEGGLHADGARWLAAASTAVLKVLDGGEALTFPELRARVPLLAGSVEYAPDRKWGGAIPVGSRVLTVLSAEGRIVRGANRGGWHVSRPEWASMARWLGAPLEVPSAAEGTAALVRAWLRAFGPGTEADLRWWLGSTLTAIRRALADVDAVEVALYGGDTGHVLPDDVDEAPPVDPWVALLPPLDPTPMGWAGRAWYLGAHKAHVFDVNGNVGPTVWCDGRIVGGWRQTAGGTIELQLLEDVGRARRRALDAEARRLGAWMKGLAVKPRFPSPLSKR